MSSYLILHGYGGSGPQHWQTWLAGRLREAELAVHYPDLPDPTAPRLAAWRDALADALAVAGEAPVVVCHSLACILWLHHALDPVAPGRAARVLLVAPPVGGLVPARTDFFPVELDAEAVSVAARATTLVSAPGDPYCPDGADAVYGAQLDAERIVLPEGAGHINPETGYGPWPAVETWCLDGDSGGFGGEERG